MNPSMPEASLEACTTAQRVIELLLRGWSRVDPVTGLPDRENTQIFLGRGPMCCVNFLRFRHTELALEFH